MLFNSFNFLIFFPIVILIYFILPKKIKNIWLLISSYYFYMCWNPKYVILLLLSTITTYACSLGISKYKNKKTKKLFVVASISFNLLILVLFKYYNFLFDNLKILFMNIGIRLNMPTFDFLLPVGISFYTFQALGYTIDVYRNEIDAEKNFFKYALFVSFFPQLVAGPIERSKNLLNQLDVPKKFNYDKARHGFLVMLWGFFIKMVIADRIAIFVDCVYNNHIEYTGWYLVIATILFAFQIYCDFFGYSTIAVGAAEVLGINLCENFNSPYLSMSIKEFWRRWHISLSSWFKDYLYIPLGGNRNGKFRKNLNLLIVFGISGLWHGANWTFVVWGLLNGLYQVIGDILKPIRQKIINFLKIDMQLFCNKVLKIIFTFILINFSWIFFRANNINVAINIVKSILFAKNPWILFDGSLYNCGLDQKDFRVLIIGLVVLLIADICKYKKISISKFIEKQSLWFRWIVYISFIISIITFGIWGSTYNAQGFIYFQF